MIKQYSSTQALRGSCSCPRAFSGFSSSSIPAALGACSAANGGVTHARGILIPARLVGLPWCAPASRSIRHLAAASAAPASSAGDAAAGPTKAASRAPSRSKTTPKSPTPRKSSSRGISTSTRGAGAAAPPPPPSASTTPAAADAPRVPSPRRARSSKAPAAPASAPLLDDLIRRVTEGHQQLRGWAAAYYNGAPIVSDDVYDQVAAQVADLEGRLRKAAPRATAARELLKSSPLRAVVRGWSGWGGHRWSICVCMRAARTDPSCLLAHAPALPRNHHAPLLLHNKANHHHQ